MRAALFFASHYSIISVFGAISYGIGRRLMLRCHHDNWCEQFAVCTSLGIGVLACLVFLTALFHLLYREVLIALLICAILGGVPVWHELWTDCRNRHWKSNALFAYLAGFVLIFLAFRPLWMAPLYPPTAFDSTMYHLANGKLDVQMHSLFFTPYIRFSSLPQLNEMLFALMLSIFDDVSAQLVQFFMMFLIGAALYAWGRRWFNGRVGLWAGAMWISSPLVIWLGASAYVDIGVALFVTLGILCFFNWRQTDENAWLALSAAFLAFGAASKYTGLFPLAIISLVLLYISIRGRRFRQLIIFMVIAAAIAGPWYVRNYHLTGNPVFPEAGSIFGYGQWTAQEAQGHRIVQASYGSGKTLKALLLLPWNVTFHPSPFTYAPITPLYLFLLPLVFAAASWRRMVRTLLLASAALILCWFYTVQILRFLTIAFPIFSLTAAASFEEVRSRVTYLRKFGASRVFTGIGALILLMPAWQYIALSPALLTTYAKKLALNRPAEFWWPELFASLPTTAKERDVYLKRERPTYPLIAFLNRTRGQTYTLYAFGATQLAYFADGRFIGDWFGPGRYSQILDVRSNPGALYNVLTKLDVDYFLVDFENFPVEDFLDPSFLSSSANHLKLVSTVPGALLFKILDRGSSCVVGGEILKNGSFEKVTDAKPEHWVMIGKPRIDNSTHFSYSGASAVGVQEDNYFFQRVAIQPGHLYILSHFSRSPDSSSVARLQINWLSNADKTVAVAIRGVHETSQWQQHRMAVKAPENAFWADVYASAGGGGAVWLDEFSLTELTCK